MAGPPHIHILHFPKNLAETFSQGRKQKYNEYAIRFCRANNPDKHIIKVNKKEQDPFEQGIVYGIYKVGCSPAEIAAKRAEKEKEKRGRKK